MTVNSNLYNPSDLERHLVLNSTSAPSGFREKERTEYNQVLIRNNTELEDKAAYDKKIYFTPLALRLAQEARQDWMEFKNKFNLTFITLEVPFPDFQERFQNVTAYLGKGLTQEQIEKSIHTGGFSQAAIDFEAELRRPIQTLLEIERLQHNRHFLSTRESAKTKRAQLKGHRLFDSRATDVTIDLFMESMKNAMDLFQEKQDTQLLLKAYRLAAVAYSEALNDIERINMNYGTKIYRSLDALQDIGNIMSEAEMHIRHHFAIGFFDLKVYFDFFTEYLQNETDEVSSLEQILTKHTLLPRQYLFELVSSATEAQISSEVLQQVFDVQLRMHQG